MASISLNTHNHVLLAGLVLFQILLLATANIQLLVLKSEDGQNETIESNARDLSKVSEILLDGKAISEYCTTGLTTWLVFPEINYNEDSDETPFISRLIGGSTCNTTELEPKSARHVGNVDATKSGLSLYAKENLHGRELYFDGDVLRLPEPFRVVSYGFTGLDRWELYANRELVGRGICLQRDSANNFEAPWWTQGGRGTIDLLGLTRGCPSSPYRANIHPPDPPRKSADRLTLPLLKLYMEADKKGGELFLDGREVRLPYAYNFSSIDVTGNWQVFSGRDFDGTSECLSIATNKNFKHLNGTIEVGSIKLGCGHPINNDDDDSAASPLTSVQFSIILSMIFPFIIGKFVI